MFQQETEVDEQLETMRQQEDARNSILMTLIEEKNSAMEWIEAKRNNSNKCLLQLPLYSSRR